MDLRKESPTFGQWDSVTLTVEDRNMVLVPAGCAHGILTLSDDTEMLYFVSEDYHPESERCLRWNDPTFGIDWPLQPQSFYPIRIVRVYLIQSIICGNGLILCDQSPVPHRLQVLSLLSRSLRQVTKCTQRVRKACRLIQVYDN